MFIKYNFVLKTNIVYFSNERIVSNINCACLEYLLLNKTVFSIKKFKRTIINLIIVTIILLKRFFLIYSFLNIQCAHLCFKMTERFYYNINTN